MRRRAFIALIGGTALGACGGAQAQNSLKVPCVGLLAVGPPPGLTTDMGSAFVRGMARQGYVVGQNFTLEPRGAMSRVEQLPRFAQELADGEIDAR